MIKTCKEYLAERLRAAGVSKISFSREGSDKHNVPPFAVVLTGDETMRYDGSMVAKGEGPGVDERTYRRRTHRRALDLKVLIVHRTDDEAQAVGETFLTGLTRRILDDQGNAILVAVRGSEPDEEDRSILRQRSGAVYLVTFEGGVYQDKVVKVLPLETAMEVEQELTEEV